ncbi:saccharopine dehydrogenase family protein [Corynebacterium sp. L4756]|uniref:saccharopine dehydrogenase family protein n=1 Tax=unclassified Corynebacterium TaxID=2624378 RepID=UPI00374CD546
MSQDSNGTSSREFDVVVFGATSFVGRLTAEYLAENHPELSLALAGRNETKLSALGLGLPVLLADATDTAALSTLAQRTRVLISTVGPYTHYGDEVVKACVEAGTHYVDLCGEALFIRRNIDGLHEKARANGAKIVHSCGFDSVPSDMGLFHLHEKSGATFTDVTMAVEHLQGGLSGGTIDSMRAVSTDAKKMEKGGAILHSPYTLSPDHKTEPDLGEQKDMEVTFDPLLRQWTGPFFMAMFNTRIVRRTNTLRGYAYGEQLRYREAITTGTGIAGRIKAGALFAITALGFAAVMNKRLARFLPQPGDGPKDLDKGGFTITHVGRTESGALHTATVIAEGDPGYRVTSMMLGEAAATLATNPKGMPDVLGGILTPATALGAPYRDALHAHGMRFK